MGCCQKDEEYAWFMEGVEELFGIDLDEVDSTTKNNWNFCEWRDDFIAWLRDNAIILGCGGVGTAIFLYWLFNK